MKTSIRPTYEELVDRVDELERKLIQHESNQTFNKQDYKRLFDNALISIWNQDFTLAFEQLNHLKKLDITDINEYLKDNPNVLSSLVSKLKVNSINKATLKLFEAESDREFLNNIKYTFGDGSDVLFTEIIESIWNNKKSFISEVNYRTLKGNTFAALFSIPIPQTKQEQRSVPVTIQSVQALKEAESAKKESLSKLQQAQKLSHIGSWEWEWDTDHAIWSDEMYRIYGVNKDEFEPTSENVNKTILEEDKYKMKHAISQLLNGKMADPFEFRITRPNNEIRNLSILALQISGGKIFGVTQDITDRKRIENELNVAQTLAKVGSWVFNTTTEKISWSNEMFNIWGFNLRNDAPDYDELVKRVHPDDLELWNSSVDEAIRLGIPYDIEHRILLPNGEHKVIRGICKPVLGVNGEVVSLTGTGQDITKQKLLDSEITAAKEKAEDSEYYLNNIINNIGDPVFVKDDKFRLVLVNDSFCKLLGVNKNRVIGKTMAEDLPIKQMEGFLKIDKQVLTDGKENLNEEVISHASGAELTIITKKSRYIDEHGKKFIIGTIRDITGAKVIQKELDSQNEKLIELNNTLNQAQTLAKVGSWIYDPFTKRSEWSLEMFRIWSFDAENSAPSLEEIVKRIHPDDLDLFTSCLDKAIQLGIPYDIEFRILSPNVPQKIVKAICLPILDDDDKVSSLSGTNQDITSQKLFEEAHVKHQRFKAIGEMSSSIAHDFNNSLQEMIGNLEIIKFQKNLSDITVNRLNSVMSIIGDVAERVSALQNFNDTKHIDKNAIPLDLNILIEESLTESRPLWKDAMERVGIRINIITHFQDIPKITCIGGELKSVVYNLIKNSIEAMPEGGDLTIKTGVKGEGVYATFIDTGIGMSQETKLKIFEPFFTTKGFELGRGLGLSGVYSIVKKHKGDIVVTASEIDKGTTIDIVFPISDQDEIKVLSNNESKVNQSYRVLWVDDDAIISKSSSILVESIGHTCNTVNSGMKALKYLNDNSCDIVFTDIGMPVMNGWELADSIRKEFGEKIKIVIVTGWDIDEKVKEAHGIDSYLQKPFTLEQLKKTFLKL